MSLDEDGCQNEEDVVGHLCPFSLEVDNEYTECTCCAECTEQCAEAI